MTTTQVTNDIVKVADGTDDTDRLNVPPSYTPAALKNLVGSKLIVTECFGHWWATNSYWITPASRFVPMFERYLSDEYKELLLAEKVSEGAPFVGVWDLYGQELKRTAQEPPNMETFINVKHSKGEVLRRERIEDSRVYVKTQSGDVTAVFDAPVGGWKIGLNDDYLMMLLGAALVHTYGRRYPIVEIRGESALRPVNIWGHAEVKKGGHRDPTVDEYKFIPETWSFEGWDLLGVLMPVRLRPA